MQIKQEGMVHIRLPFKSMDDISFEGTYAPLADALVATLKDHIDAQKEAEEAYNPPEPEIESSAVETEQPLDLPKPKSNLQKAFEKYTVDPIKRAMPPIKGSVIREDYGAK